MFAHIYVLNSGLFFTAQVRTSTSDSPLTNSHRMYNEVSDLWPVELLKFRTEILKIQTKIKIFGFSTKAELPTPWTFPSNDIN